MTDTDIPEFLYNYSEELTNVTFIPNVKIFF